MKKKIKVVTEIDQQEIFPTRYDKNDYSNS